MLLDDMLSRGYFPKELPRSFVSNNFAHFITSQSTFSNDFGLSAQNRSLPKAKYCRYSHARVGLLRRSLAITHPLYQYHLSNEILANWNSLTPSIGGTSISGTMPEFKPIGRAINGKYSQNDRSLLCRKSRIGNRYILKTDISRFYHSIYTHSIPWALHTKAVSKNNHGMNLLGNRLDYWLRQGQDGQTIGIPIGPDTSLVISEIIMQKCDNELLSKIPKLKGARFIDDYELAFSTRTEAEEAFHILESCLSEFEIALNPKKTMVSELPESLELEWVAPLKDFKFRSTQQGQASDLETYFDLAFQLHNKHTDESVLQYAIAKLRVLTIDSNNWELFQNLLYLSIMPEPSTLPYVLEQLILRINNSGFISEKIEIESIVNRLIIEHSILKHSSEVANSLWAALAMNLSISNDAAKILSQADDPVVALLALDCERNSRINAVLDKSLWISHMTKEGLYDEFWLLAYEANLKGWLPNHSSIDYVNADPNFKILKDNNISFYDSSLVLPGVNGIVPLPTVPTIPTSNLS